MTYSSEPYTSLATAWHPPADTIATRIPSLTSRGSSRLITTSPDYRRIHLESGLEMKVFLLIVRRRPFHIWDQPPAVLYVGDDGKPHRHTFDFLVTWQNGTKTAVIVKVATAVEKYGWRNRRDQLAAANPNYADEFAIVTERQCPQHEVFNASLIYETRGMPDDHADAQLRDIVDGLQGQVRIADLVAYSGLKGRGFRAIVRLIDDGRLVQVRKERIDYPALIQKRSDVIGATA